MKTGTQVIHLAGGCFWGLEKYMAMIPGVLEVESGYANGKTDFPTYEEVCSGQTGYAETVRVVYDPSTIELGRILELYFDAIDPHALNRQGFDVGTQYRTGIYYDSEADGEVSRHAVAALAERSRKPVAVEVLPIRNYYRAEEYHQKYLNKHPGGYCHIGRETFNKLKKAVEQR
ncbi:MAG TPA: peptide-methionine (S)-S-oxide reductase MsrA [Clostridiales bacterium]|jgi:methionine-S-sulfoxide reductase|nr:peptide-methionine (S)-S-oxide reductase MsrA [Clostridiales bacterium]